MIKNKRQLQEVAFKNKCYCLICTFAFCLTSNSKSDLANSIKHKEKNKPKVVVARVYPHLVQRLNLGPIKPLIKWISRVDSVQFNPKFIFMQIQKYRIISSFKNIRIPDHLSNFLSVIVEFAFVLRLRTVENENRPNSPQVKYCQLEAWQLSLIF